MSHHVSPATRVLLALDRLWRAARRDWCARTSHRWLVAPSGTFRVCLRCPTRQVKL